MDGQLWGAPISELASTFSKDDSTGSIGGHFLEIRMIALLFLKAINPVSAISKFKLACNFKTAKDKLKGDFQDVGIQYELPTEQASTSSSTSAPEVHVLLYQLKYHEKTFSLSQFFPESPNGKFNGDFNLRPHYRWMLKFVTSDLREAANVNFVLFTNADVIKRELDAAIKNGDVLYPFEDELLRTRTATTSSSRFGQYFKFNCDLKKWLDALTIEEHDDNEENRKIFLSKLRIYTGQPKLQQLEAMIADELRVVYNLTPTESDLYVGPFINIIQNWWHRSGKTKYLFAEDKMEIWKCVKVQTITANLELNSSFLMKEINTLNEAGIGFQDDKSLAELVLTHNIINIQVNKGTPRMSVLKFYQNLNLIDLSDKFIVTKMEYLLKEHEYIKFAWYRSKKPMLIIVCPNKSDDIPLHILESLLKLEESYNYFGTFGNFNVAEAKIIFINLSAFVFDTLQATIESQYGTDTYQFGHIKSSIDFTSLTDDSKEIILSKEIIVCDKNDSVKAVQLKDLTPVDVAKLKEETDIELILLLMLRDTITVINTNKIELNDLVDAMCEGGELVQHINNFTNTTVNIKNSIQNVLKTTERNMAAAGFLPQSFEECREPFYSVVSTLLGAHSHMTNNVMTLYDAVIDKDLMTMIEAGLKIKDKTQDVVNVVTYLYEQIDKQLEKK